MKDRIPNPAAAFPCGRVPDDRGAARLIGLYPQRRSGRWMQRVKVLGGRLTAGQWRALAGIARRFTPRTPLHLTTRQDVELHDLTDEQVPAVQRALARADLTGVAACGDTLRNVTVCPCSGAAAGSVDLVPLAWQIRRMLEARDDICRLPRKFKIALSCSPRCGQPWINDLGLTALFRDGQWGFRVTVAGSLGSRPGTGMLWRRWAPAGEVLYLAGAAVRLFAAHGDRTNRRRARLRHVRERVGNTTFLRMLEGSFAAVRSAESLPEPQLSASSASPGAQRTLTFANGDVSPEAADALADLAERRGLRVRIATDHRVIVFGREADGLAAAVESRPALAGPARAQASILACPGRRWCKRGLTDTNALAGRIRAELGRLFAPEQTVRISGCPNGCSRQAVAEVGLMGGLAGEAGEKREVYTLRLGGDMGRTARLAQPVASRLTPDEVIARLASRFGVPGPAGLDRPPGRRREDNDHDQ